jgi:hypothetical protein
MGQRLQTRSISGDNLFVDAAEIQGYFNVGISGTWVGTVTAQRSFDLGSTWFDVNTWTANTQEYGFEPERRVQYRVGIKTGEYTSGTCVVRLSQ